MYDLSDIETKDVTFVDSQDFEDTLIEGDIHDNLDDIDHVEIKDSESKD
jgi:hypothetical protein